MSRRTRSDIADSAERDRVVFDLVGDNRLLWTVIFNAARQAKHSPGLAAF